jgi:hypothetical protein
MKQFAPLFAASIAFFSQMAHAEDSGGYFGVGFGTGQLTACTNATATCANFNANSQDLVTPAVIVGYDHNKYFGVEAGWSRLGAYKLQDSLGGTIGSVRASAITLAAKGGYKFQTGFSVFGKLGLAKVWTQYAPGAGWPLTTMYNNQRSTGVVFGLGGGYDFDEGFGLRLSSEAVMFNDAAYKGTVGTLNLTAIFRI